MEERMTHEEDTQFQKVVMEGLVPKVEGSRVCVSVVPRDGAAGIDAKFCTELGVMIMLDKPIIAIVDPSCEVPKKLELVADKIVHADIATDEGRDLFLEALDDFQKQFKQFNLTSEEES
jgi:hypothetical protein